MQYSADTPVYALNTDYLDYAKSFNDSAITKNLLQPLQIIFFNDDTVACHLINCIIGGFPNLKWNRYGTFDSLPKVNHPITTSRLSIDSLLNHISPKPSINKNENTCFVFWSNFMGRQSKNLIEYSKQNSVKKNYHVVYVNNDNFYYNSTNGGKDIIVEKRSVLN